MEIGQSVDSKNAVFTPFKQITVTGHCYDTSI